MRRRHDPGILVRILTFVTLLSGVLAGLVVPGSVAEAQTCISLTASAATENFNSLANTGTSSTLPPGWFLTETGTSGAVDQMYAAGTGSDTGGNTYSFGAASSTERAFGTLLSGTLTPFIGACFTNGTGATISGLTVSYTGEQWRFGNSSARADRLDFQYSLNATSLITGTWTDGDALDFTGTVTAPPAGPLDGNAAANRTTISSTITGLSIAPGTNVWIRWTDFNASGSDDGLAVDDFSVLAVTSGGGPTNPSATGAANPASVVQGGQTLLTATVTPGSNPTSTGITVTGNLSSISGSATQSFFDNGTNGDVTAGDNVFSFQATVPLATTPGAKSLPITVADAQTRSGSTTINLTVTAVVSIIPIGQVQGPVGASDNGAIHRSPFAPASGNSAGTETVKVQAVVYQKTLARTSGGGLQNGLFLQNTAATADADPSSSDGIFVFLGSFTTILRSDGGPAYTPTIGDEIVLRGRISEFNSLTQFSSEIRLEQVVRSGVVLNTEIPAFVANPPFDPSTGGSDLAEVNRYWERREGMRASVPTGSIAQGPRIEFASTADAELRVINPTHPVAQRSDPYARRAFRDAHPLDNLPPEFDDGNPYRILLGSLGVKAAQNDSFAKVADGARTFDTLATEAVGGIYFSFAKYSVQPAMTSFSHAADPSENNPPSAPSRATEISIATFNVENLYDFRDDPHDGCDFAGNSGCTGVSPPFDYVPANEAEYQTKLTALATQIVNDLKQPDLIMTQEGEDQDICTVSGTSLNCGSTNNADGKPDTLQELALKIQQLGGPVYDTAFDRNGADARGIVSGFMYRTDRVQLPPAEASHPVFGSSPTVNYRGAPLSYNTDVSNPKVLNADLPDDVDTSTGVDGSNVFTRPPQVGQFRIYRNTVGVGDFEEIYLLSNHFSSTPNARVGQRREQARYGAAIVAALQQSQPGARVLYGGDLNVFPRPDDPFVPGDPNFKSDQLKALYDQGLTNLFDIVVNQVPVAAYGYVFDHQAQTLDQMFVTTSLRDELIQMRVAHINADWPTGFAGDDSPGRIRGVSDHDPSLARFRLVTHSPTGRPEASITPDVIDFGDVAIGTPSPDRTVLLSNTGVLPLAVSALTVDGAHAGEFTIVSPSAPLTLQSGQIQPIVVRFTPSSRGQKTARLVIADNASGERRVALRGVGQAPEAAIAPDRVGFGRVLVNTSAAPRTVTIFNTGLAPLSVSGVTVTGPEASAFPLSGLPTFPATVNPGQVVSFTVGFNPTQRREYSARIEVSHNGTGELRVPVSGQGVLANEGGGSQPRPEANLSPNQVGFGDVPLGSTGGPRTIMVTNTGDAPLVVSAIGLNGGQAGDFSLTPPSATPLPAMIAPGASLSAEVRFTPTARGQRTANLTVTDNAPGGERRVTLRGVGQGPEATVAPDRVNFGQVAVGTSQPRSVVVTNTGLAPLHVSSVSIAGPEAGSFTVAPAGATTVAPGGTLLLTVTCAPSASGNRTARLEVNDDAPGERRVNLSCVGT